MPDHFRCSGLKCYSAGSGCQEIRFIELIPGDLGILPRMILAGIDEAGYGPLLGPLVVGASAFEIAESSGSTPVSADQSTEDLPNLWKLLRKHISKTKSPKGKKIHVNDSKLVYSTANGLKELERAILTLSTTCHGPTDSLDELLAIIEQHATPDLSTYPWYLPPTSEPLPLESDAMSIKLFANALQQEMSRAGARCVHLAARVVTERPFNALCSRTNKGNALFSIASIHLDHLVRTFGHQNLTIFCDRQGGREHYGPLLRTLFDDWTHSIDSEIPSRAAYSMTRNNPHRQNPLLRKSRSPMHACHRRRQHDQQILKRSPHAPLQRFLALPSPRHCPHRRLLHRRTAFLSRHRPKAQRTQYPRRPPRPLPVTPVNDEPSLAQPTEPDLAGPV